MNRRTAVCLVSLISIILLSFSIGCFSSSQKDEEPLPDRLSAIPEDAVKLTPEDDFFPPILHSDEWEEPIPMPGPINTAGGEDSAFITPDGKNFYVFFTPDVSNGAELQVIDGVTGIYWSRKEGKRWTTPERVMLQDKNKLSLTAVFSCREI